MYGSARAELNEEHGSARAELNDGHGFSRAVSAVTDEWMRAFSPWGNNPSQFV